MNIFLIGALPKEWLILHVNFGIRDKVYLSETKLLSAEYGGRGHGDYYDDYPGGNLFDCYQDVLMWTADHLTGTTCRGVEK